MAPSRNLPDSDTSSQVDTPMTDGNESVARIPVDEPDYPMADSDTNPNTTASSIAGDLTHTDGRKRRSEAFQLRKSVLGKQHGRLDESREDDSIRRFRYLLGLTDLFRHFIETNPNPRIKEILAEIDRQNADETSKAKGSSRKGGASGDRRRRTEKEEDAELLKDEKSGGETATIFRESPAFINGEMRDYQIAGLNWLVSLHENGISGILADEMGLGKTLQTISFLGYLRHICGINGPHLVVVPKSTLHNWKMEFAKWTPEVNVMVLQGTKEERHELITERLEKEDFDVCITSYEMILKEKSHFKKLAWEYIIIDEAHRIKNEESSLSQIIRVFHSRNRLLITGTPLQNNLHELWALLNFLLPDVFGDSEAFDQWFSNQDSDQDTVVQQLHRVLRPFLLRRVKSDVEKSLLPKKEVNLFVGMSDMQVKWYQKILEKDIDAVNGAAGKRESKTRLLNIVMQLRKCCNHPYLFEGAEPGPPYTTDEHLIDNSGKMVVLDKILNRMKKQGSRVLIFSQMSRVLDILEDYCVFREHKYCRIDGSTAHEDRIAAIDEYNREGSDKFIFLLTTRAGGLGINLTTADIVVLFDSDWNPQADLQAMDRAHRIGQKKQVVVFRFVTEHAIEEKVLERAAQKLRLDQLVIQQGRTQQQTKNAASKDELLGMIQHGAADVFKKQGGTLTGGAEMTDDDIDAILRKGEERTAELNKKYEKLGIDDLQKFTSDNAYEWNGEDFTNRKKDIGISWINPAKRERKEQFYSIDKYYRQALATGGRTADPKPKVPRAPKQVSIHDWQFFPPRLHELQEKETAYFHKEIGYKAVLADGTDEDLSEREANRDLEQQEIDNAVPLTEEEQAEKARLSEMGFLHWNRRDFQQFVNGSAKFGRTDYEGIATEVDSKTPQEVKEYAKVFWDRYDEINDYPKYIRVIEQGEEKLRKNTHQRKMLRKKLDMYRVPLQQLKINYTVSTTNKKVYSEEEDRFLLVMLDKLGKEDDTEGIQLFERMREEIRESPLFRFDWFFLSRTPVELSRRCTTLLNTIAREFEPEPKANGESGKARGRDRDRVEEDGDEDEDEAPAKKKSKNGAAVNKKLKGVKAGSKGSSASTSRAASVSSNVQSSKSKSKKK
ncbi:SNF2 family helicase/ATPase, putative [Talaromyces stipitatus ATCC 10500]|uniref:SNF2 family helicase/ATPase, putative n=1 Tax=Talaromyces stipitatus (strain ATCC 10500 / CBS 375.48 / QM 6759 / NRRL 1006) TaxID=441959 RepID=B8M9E7_TALSN|nr:SNF2 family helicase/ATPase, putative [Talaromyces stipitatus ATCC 10500]XP_002481700.1 SNF2 family helicase/ATPase, putative [Talaromyces stipitatus ATCC 10500]EED17707.1 SNF2 family helicase/ATPase, putative [Talaromyces stipitatus ATCC 10500]EED17708.1 SNF2 family helicase/ATPase, putative [Talaromyces stipitatus ATCC 10500]